MLFGQIACEVQLIGQKSPCVNRFGFVPASPDYCTLTAKVKCQLAS
jgi:hypothetical protein